MENQISYFLNKSRIAVIAITQKDGSPHAATVHYSFDTDPLIFYFSTNRKSRKAEIFATEEKSTASVVIGFSEEEWLTFQMDGVMQTVTDDKELKSIQEIHYQIHPLSYRFKDNPDTVFLKFKPSWWRFSDFSTNPPSFILM